MATEMSSPLPGWDAELDCYDLDSYEDIPFSDDGADEFALRDMEHLTDASEHVRIWEDSRRWRQLRLTEREKRMIAIMDRLTENPDWENKISSDEAWSDWLEESKVMALGVLAPMVDSTRVISLEAAMSSLSKKHSRENSSEPDVSAKRQKFEDGQEDIGDSVVPGEDSNPKQDVETDNTETKKPYGIIAPDDLDFADELEFCRKELLHRAKRSKTDGYTAVLGFGSADIVKSDTVVSESFRIKLATLLRDLLDDPLRTIESHCEQEIMVRHLVDPSLYALHFGYSLILPDEIIPLETALTYTGQGEIMPDCEDWVSSGYSREAQWLPADIRFLSTTLADGVKFVSYINNLEWPRHKSLYTALEELITHAIPLWNKCLASDIGAMPRRIDCRDENQLWRYPDEGIEPPDLFEDDFGETYDVEDAVQEYEEMGLTQEEAIRDHRENWRLHARVYIDPKPTDFETFHKDIHEQPLIDLFQSYKHEGLQVIVKVTEVHLTPENPTYSGGPWHVEGLANEHICATAIYYYDTHNIRKSYLAFRGGAFLPEELMDYEPGEFWGLEQAYHVDLEGDLELQDLAIVSTPMRRLLAFPNVFQHAMPPFELEDKTEPGYRKMVVLCLVNPDKRIISTQHVPPQQRERFEMYLRRLAAAKHMPGELQEMIATANTAGLNKRDEAVDMCLGQEEERAALEWDYITINRTYDFR